jgi:hypothetical protein
MRDQNIDIINVEDKIESLEMKAKQYLLWEINGIASGLIGSSCIL